MNTCCTKYQLLFHTKILLIPVIYLIIQSCSGSPVNTPVPDDNIKQEQPDTTRQVTTSDTANTFYGEIIQPPLQLYHIKQPVQATVSRCFIENDMQVLTGQVLFEYTSSKLIGMQQQYLISENDYQYHRKNFKRQGELAIDNATSLKTMEQIQYKYHEAEISYNICRAQLQTYGINPDSVSVNNIQQTFTYKSPVNGKISGLYIFSGAFLLAGAQVCDIEIYSQAKIQFTPHSNVLNSAMPGSIMYFQLPGDTKQYEATVMQQHNQQLILKPMIKNKLLKHGQKVKILTLAEQF